MASWILVPCLVSLRNEFNKLAPDRDKASDGSIGDTSHAASSSDHNPDETGNTPYEDADSKNEVHAIDVDNNLNKSGWTMTKCVQVIVTRHRNGQDDRLQNVIWNRTIWSRSWGWTARTYTGSSPHTEHAHFSARYTTAQESDTSPWGLLEAEEDDMPSAAEVAAEVIKQLEASRGQAAIGKAVLTFDPGLDSAGKIKPGGIQNMDANGYKTNPTVGLAWVGTRVQVNNTLGYQNRDRLDKVLATLATLAAAVGVAQGDIDAIQAQIDALPGEVVDALTDPATSPETVAANLQPVLGDRAAAVGKILAAGA